MRNLDDADKQLLMRAVSYLKTANDVLDFLSNYFRDKYKLQPGDEITPTGEILSLSNLQQKEKLNGTPINTGDGTESNGTPPELSAMLNLSGNVALLHGTTEDN